MTAPTHPTPTHPTPTHPDPSRPNYTPGRATAFDTHADQAMTLTYPTPDPVTFPPPPPPPRPSLFGLPWLPGGDPAPNIPPGSPHPDAPAPGNPGRIGRVLLAAGIATMLTSTLALAVLYLAAAIGGAW